MLTEQEIQEIGAEVGEYGKRAACVEALNIVQRYRGWISDGSLRAIAELLDMSAAELDGVASFYNHIYRKEVGTHVILLCNTISCWIMGHEDILHHLRLRLGIGFGETSSDGLFTLLPVPCLGACDKAPAMMIDDDLHTGLTLEKVDLILSQYREKER